MKKNALEEAESMMDLPYEKLPKIVTDYLNYLYNCNGCSGDMVLLAYAHYCQAELELECNDEIYKITDKSREWFDNYEEEIPVISEKEELDIYRRLLIHLHTCRWTGHNESVIKILDAIGAYSYARTNSSEDEYHDLMSQYKTLINLKNI